MRRSKQSLVLAAVLLLGAACGDSSDGQEVDAAVESPTSQDPGNEVSSTSGPTQPNETASSNVPSEQCGAALDAIGPAEALATSDDALDLIAEDRLAGLLLPGHEQRELIGLEYFDQPEQLIFPTTAAPDRQLGSLRSNRFVEGYNATYAFGVDSYSLFALSFPSPEASRAYHGVYLESVCSSIGRDMDRLGNSSSGVTFVTDTGFETYTHAAIAVGNVELILTLCVCIETTDHRQVLTDWIDAITAQLAGRTSANV